MKLVWRQRNAGVWMHVDHRGDFLERRVLVHVGEHRNADLLLDLGEDLQALLHARAAVALARGAVRLVERALEDVGHAELARCAP